jgi:hypothetical protein
MSYRDNETNQGSSLRRRQSLPRVLCDFNSSAWSGEDDDECYYSFDLAALQKHRPRAGMRVFIYERSRDDLVVGCEAVLEEYRHPVTQDVRWRLRPLANTGYFGELK